MASFTKYLPKYEAAEGGFQKIESDPGNFNSKGELAGTKYGISARFYETIIGYPPTEADIRAITKAKANAIIKQHFWDKNLGDQIKNQSVAETVIDHAINAGNGVKLAQQTLNHFFGFNLSVDNGMGPKTLAALNSVSSKAFVEEYNRQRKAYYVSIGNDEWVDGWLNRLSKFVYKNTAVSAGVILTLTALTYLGYQYFSNQPNLS